MECVLVMFSRLVAETLVLRQAEWPSAISNQKTWLQVREAAWLVAAQLQLATAWPCRLEGLEAHPLYHLAVKIMGTQCIASLHWSWARQRRPRVHV